MFNGEIKPGIMPIFRKEVEVTNLKLGLEMLQG